MASPPLPHSLEPPGAGHDPMEETPLQLIRAVEGFLRVDQDGGRFGDRLA